LDTIKLLLLVKAVCKLDHVEELQSFKLSKSIKKKRQNTHNQKWAVLSIASIPLIMTLGNSMFIPVLTEMQKQQNRLLVKFGKRATNETIASERSINAIVSFYELEI
jgi:hypothetical protein